MDYLRYWSLSAPPFGPATSCFFHGKPQRKAIDWAAQLVFNRQPLGIMDFQAGTGATQLLQQLSTETGFDRCAIEGVYTSGHQASVERTFSGLAKSLGLNPRRDSFGSVVRALESNQSNGIRTVWLVDEIGKHSIDAVSRTLTRNYGLTIIASVTGSLSRLVGRRFNRRTPWMTLEKFDLADTHEFLQHCLHGVGCNHTLFSSEAATAIHNHASGRVRKVAKIADAALRIGHQQHVDQIDPALVETAISRTAAA